MTAKIIQIGNSKGIRLPKAMLEESGLAGEVNLRVEGHRILIEPARSADPRAGWDEAFRKAIAEHGNDLADEDHEWLDAPLSEQADKDWTW